MRIIFITNYKRGAGSISGQVDILVHHLSYKGITSEIFSTKGSLFYRLLCGFKLLSKGKDFDIFHIHCCSFFGFFPAIIGISVGKLLRKKIILTYHGGEADTFFSKNEWMVKFFLRKTDHNIVLSEYLGQIFDKYQIPYTVIPNILIADRAKFRAREPINPTFISIRTLAPLYNIECIIKAFSIVKKQIPNAKLIIVGDGPSREALEKTVISLNLSDVSFTGKVSNTEIYKMLDKADILVSAPFADNMPISVLEAFDAGLLVISSNVGGVPYMINSGDNGLLFDSNDELDLANKMIFAVNNQEESKQMIKNAHSSLRNYSWDNSWKKLSYLYEN